MDNFDDFSKKIGLTEDQKQAIMTYILEILADNLRSMKEEYNLEIDKTIEGLKGGTN